MLDKEYEQLVECLQSMISDGVQFVYHSHQLDWKDTKILPLLRKIERKKKKIEGLICEECEPLVNRHTGEFAGVILIDSKNVTLLPHSSTIVFPREKLWYHYRRPKPDDYEEAASNGPLWLNETSAR